MNADRWQRIDGLYHCAAALPGPDRHAFLATECQDDPSLIVEVESLLRHGGDRGCIFDTPAIDVVARAIAADETWVSSSLLPGKMLTHYRIEQAIGRGGMGVVYKAEDVKLGRAVALKLLPDYLARDVQALQRFEREARAASALNHPNICTVYEIDRVDDLRFIAIEYLEGESLKDRIARGALDIADILRIAVDICHALEAAHSSGIVHRDIKPANVFLTRRGNTKVLDFGAAKRLGSEPTDSVDDASNPLPVESIDPSLTLPGSALGTVAYMSPEQASGLPADPRSDIFSLGAVIYEMAAGRPPVASRDSPDECPVHSLHAASPLAVDTSGLPSAVARIIDKALARDRADRYPHVAEMRADLETVQLSRVQAAHRWRTAWVGIAIAGVVASIAWAVRNHVAPSGRETHAITSLAILPFRHLNAEAPDDRFADDVTTTLITDLSRLRSVRIAPESASSRYKATTKTAVEVARDLSVRALIKGTVDRAGDRIRVSARLIDGNNEQSLWTASYERAAGDVLKLQHEMALALAHELVGKLSAGEQAGLATDRRSVNPASYEAYLRAGYFYERDSFSKADEYYRKAIELDPSFASAYLGAAQSVAYQAYTSRVPAAPAWERAETLLAKSLVLDPDSALAHTLTGMILFQFHCDRAGAERELQRAVELNPGDLDSLDYHSYFLMEVGRSDEGIAEKKRVLEDDPVAVGTAAELGLYYLLAGRNDEAIAQLEKTLELDPTFQPALIRLGRAYVNKGRYAEAVVQFKNALAGEQNAMALGNLGYAYALWHKRAEAMDAIRQMRNLSTQRFVPPSLIARIYAALGDTESALAWLARADVGDRRFITDADFDGLRADPRFTAIAARLRPSDQCPLM